MLFRITRDCDAAYDAVQEALMRAWKNVAYFEGRAQFSTWLTRIGVNEAYRGLRSPAEEPLELTDHVGERIPARGARPDEFLTAVDMHRTTAGGLPHRCDATRRGGLSTADAAQATGAVTRHTRISPNCRRMLAHLTRTVSGLRALRSRRSAGDVEHRRD